MNSKKRLARLAAVAAVLALSVGFPGRAEARCGGCLDTACGNDPSVCDDICNRNCPDWTWSICTSPSTACSNGNGYCSCTAF